MDAWERWRDVCLATLSVEDIEDIYLFGTLITGVCMCVGQVTLPIFSLSWSSVFDTLGSASIPQPDKALTSPWQPEEQSDPAVAEK
ncbi:hypothetical protein MHYP_G00298890 [Metynnis hypsauchen]